MPSPLPNLRETKPADPLWHTLTINRALVQLETDAQIGLTEPQVIDRQQKFGANELVAAASRQWWQILLDQFTNIMLVMLIFVALISGIFDFTEIQAGKTSGLPYKDTIAILSIVILNGILGYVQESRAEQALAALKRMSAPKVRVLRDSKISEIDGRELVPGDLIYLEAGNQLAADARLIEAVQLQIRESALTGEATASSKTAATELATDTSLGDRINLVYQGTEITTGRGVAVVTATGMNTELGKIAALLQGVESQPTPLQQKLAHLGNVLVMGGNCRAHNCRGHVARFAPRLLQFGYLQRISQNISECRSSSRARRITRRHHYHPGNGYSANGKTPSPNPQTPSGGDARRGDNYLF
jgi:P-type Ca2+ transporter type 2C